MSPKDDEGYHYQTQAYVDARLALVRMLGMALNGNYSDAGRIVAALDNYLDERKKD